jgi:hypothetical protein
MAEDPAKHGENGENILPYLWRTEIYHPLARLRTATAPRGVISEYVP